MGLYAKSMALNPLDAFVPLRYGMCLDWLGQTNEAGLILNWRQSWIRTITILFIIAAGIREFRRV